MSNYHIIDQALNTLGMNLSLFTSKEQIIRNLFERYMERQDEVLDEYLKLLNMVNIENISNQDIDKAYYTLLDYDNNVDCAYNIVRNFISYMETPNTQSYFDSVVDDNEEILEKMEIIDEYFRYDDYEM